MILKFMWILVSSIDKVFLLSNKRFGSSSSIYTNNQLVFWLVDKNNYYGVDILGWNFIISIKREIKEKKKKRKEKKNHTCNKLQVEGCDIGLYSKTRRGNKS